MKRYLLGLILLSLCFPGCQQAPAQATADQAGLPPIEVFFSPKGGCTEAVVKELALPSPPSLCKPIRLLRAHRQSPGRCLQAWREGRSHPRQEPEGRESTRRRIS